MKIPKIIYDVLAYGAKRLENLSASFDARNKVAAVSSPAFSNVCYDVVRADKNIYRIDIEIERLDAVYKLLCMGVRQEDVLYLVDHNREREWARVLACL